MRVKRIILKHHGNVAVARCDFIDRLVANQNFTRGDIFQTRQHAQRGALATAGRADKNDELAITDGQINAVNDLKLTVFLDQIAELDCRHCQTPGSRTDVPAT